MPYFITDTAAGCSGWATIKDDGEVIGCHETKEAAIEQMVAVSLAEGIEPGGERALPDNYRPALSPDVPEGRACGNCLFYNEANVQDERGFSATALTGKTWLATTTQTTKTSQAQALSPRICGALIPQQRMAQIAS